MDKKEKTLYCLFQYFLFIAAVSFVTLSYIKGTEKQYCIDINHEIGHCQAINWESSHCDYIAKIVKSDPKACKP